jgi:Phage integrase, N-terminal SAM-like domain
VARRRFQSGWLYKRGKRRKVWVGRWREEVTRADGTISEIRRSVVLGSVAELPTRREAQVKLDKQLRSVNLGTSKPESFLTLGTFVDQQWMTLVFPTFKASTQHGYKTVLNNHVLPAWRDWHLRDIERLVVQQWIAERFRQGQGWQSVRNAWVLLSGTPALRPRSTSTHTLSTPRIDVPWKMSSSDCLAVWTQMAPSCGGRSTRQRP